MAGKGPGRRKGDDPVAYANKLEKALPTAYKPKWQIELEREEKAKRKGKR